MREKQTSAWVGLIYLFLIVFLGGFFIGQFLFLIGAMALGIDINQITSDSLIKNGISKQGLLIVQWVISACRFILLPYLFIRFSDQFNLKQKLFDQQLKLSIRPLLLAGIILLLYLPCSALLVEWNKSVIFPESLSGIEQAFRQMEDSATKLTSYIIDFDSFGHFLLAFVVVAITPAIGEELLFRGVLQNYMQLVIKNKHIAIWVSAFIFSAWHMQFYGLVPRMVLGAVLGYVYFWSGSLIVPIVVHLLNNGLTLLAMYLYQQGTSSINVQDTESVSVGLGLASALITIGLLLVFRKISGYEEKQEESPIGSE